MPKATDAEVTALLIKGDEQAFSAVFRKYYSDLTLFACTFLRNHQSAEETVQDVFMMLWGNHTDLIIVNSLKSFLLKSVQNRCTDLLRHDRVKNKTGIYVQQIVYYDHCFERTGENFEIAGNLVAGAYMYLNDGYYYFLGSCGSCSDGANSAYPVKVGRSREIRGSFPDPQENDLKQNVGEPGKLLIRGNGTADGFAGSGHNDEILSDRSGNLWFNYLAIEKENDRLGNGATRRPLMIDRLKWFEGWPSINYAELSRIRMAAPDFENAETKVY